MSIRSNRQHFQPTLHSPPEVKIHEITMHEPSSILKRGHKLESIRLNRLELTTVCRIANTKDESTLVGCIGQPSPLKPFLAENNSLQSSNCNILGLAVTVAFFSNEARFTQIQVFFRACSLKNEVGNPPFFYISDITSSSTFNGKIYRKKSMLENFRANVLKQ